MWTSVRGVRRVFYLNYQFALTQYTVGGEYSLRRLARGTAQSINLLACDFPSNKDSIAAEREVKI